MRGPSRELPYDRLYKMRVYLPAEFNNARF
jgi:hypothetical protein